MTISSSTRKAGPFPGNGATTAFAFAFKVFAQADLLAVRAITSTGVETTLALTTDYTITLNADQNANPGGVLTMLVAPPTGTTITITSQVANTQGTDLTNLGGFYPTVINDALDRATIQIQQLTEKTDRALTLSPSTSGASATLPTPVAGQLLGWNEAGTAIANYSGIDGGTVVSAVMVPAVTATTLPLARTALGAAASGSNSDITSLSGLKSINNGPVGGFRNRIINGNFGINQRAVSGTVVLAAGVYGHDRWKAGASGCTYTFATSANVTTLTISAGSLQQVIEGLNLESGTYALSWTGTSTGKIGAGSYAASGVTGAVTGGTNTTIEFSSGTVSKVQFEIGTPTVFEQRPYGMELTLCQRYYYRLVSDSALANSVLAPNVLVDSTTSAQGYTGFPTTMRAAPTALEQTGVAANYIVRITGGAQLTCSSVPLFQQANIWGARSSFVTASGLTGGQSVTIQSAVATGIYLGWSAEL